MSSFPLTQELKEILDSLYDQPSLVTDRCTQDGIQGRACSCSAIPCEPGPGSIRSIVLLPAEYEYLKALLSQGEMKFEDKFEAVKQGVRCPFNINGRCTAGPHGSLRPFACRSFPMHFQYLDTRAVEMYLNISCAVVRDQFSVERVKVHVKAMMQHVIAMWPYMPPWWHELWNKSRTVLNHNRIGTLRFDIELDTIEFSKDTGPVLASANLMKALADVDCPHCLGSGLDAEAVKLNKGQACLVCSGPRYWNMDHFTKQEEKSRSMADE